MARGGVKGRSGRKSLKDEQLAAHLADLSVRTCIKAINREGEYADLSREVILELASKFAVKAIPQFIESDTMDLHSNIYIVAPKSNTADINQNRVVSVD
jgi:hypothetical protein